MLGGLSSPASQKGVFKMIEITVFGRGGQGAVTASEVIAIAAFNEGYEVQAFPMFGVERSGAPVKAFARVSKNKINLRSQVYKSDYAIVLDSSLIKIMNVEKETKKLIIVNTKKKLNTKYRSVDATSMALKVIGKPFVNIGMVAAFARVTGLFSLKSLLKAIDEVFEDKKEVKEKNKELAKNIYEAI